MIWPHAHNWRAPVIERLAWLTDVTRAWDGSESRTALRAWPRRVLEYQVTASGREAAAIDGALWTHGAELWEWVPVWGDASRLEAAAAAGAEALEFDTADRGFRAGGDVMIRTAWDAYELASVVGVAPGGVTLAAPLQAAWPARAAVLPLIRARLPDRHAQRRITAGLGDSPVTWEQYDPHELDEREAEATYRGIEVLTRRPNRADPIALQYQRSTDRIESEPGLVVVLDRSGRPRTTQALEFILRSRAEYRAMVRWFYRRQGRRAAFWCPTWQTDLQPVAGLVAEDEVLTVHDAGVRDTYDGAAARRDVQILVRGRPPIYRRVLTAEAGTGGTEVLGLDAPIGVDASPGEVRMVSWLALCRLAADTVEIARYTAGVSRAVVSAMTLDHDESDDDASA